MKRCNPCPNPYSVCSCILHPIYLRVETHTSLKKILIETAQDAGIDPFMLSAPTKKKKITKIRDIAIRKCKDETDATLEQIGKVFKRNHSSILYSLNKTELNKTERRWDCPEYSKCLDEAAKQNIKEIDCKKCDQIPEIK